MRDGILASLLTFCVFAIGFGSGMWIERHRPFPPPPGSFMGEFMAARHNGPSRSIPINRAQLSEQIEKLKPQIDDFRNRVNDIYAQFDKDMATVLTPDQQALYTKRFHNNRVAPPPQDDRPLSDDEIERLLQRPFRTLAYFVVLPMTLERMTTELKLDDAQRDKVRDFLRIRREKFIELVDSAPPPSLLLSRLAPVAQRLGQQPQPASAH